ncbi:BamA/TamA family outer membrane protein [Botryobacter ruber]|uniref:hypothetical protein n=1 Tax=Botryobacter ruber TaxID=2171629 RepID=UPI000E0A8130|nr:hypothetical protein [Botryobacter ruber]
MFALHHCFIRSSFFCLLSMLLVVGFCQAQETPPTSTDTIRNATLQDTARQKFDERIIENLRQLSERQTIMGKLLKAMLVFDRHEEEVQGLDAELIAREYAKHNYKIVRRIEIRTLDAFGYSINDTSRAPRNFAEKAANSLHVKTRQSLIRNILLFEQNEPLEPLALIESERLLRQTSYLLDARITINEATTTNDSVDVFVLTKDVFSLGGSASYRLSSRSGRIAPRELNFLGLGHQVRTSYRFNTPDPRPWDFSAAYAIENISNTYVSADLIYTNENFRKEKSAYLRRDFFSLNTKYAGALGLSWKDELFLLPPEPKDTAARFTNISYNRRDAWIGRSFKFKSYNLGYEPRSRTIVALRLIDTEYDTPPTENIQSNTLLLASVGYSIRRYYKDRFLFGFGRTEDIPAGMLLTLTTGVEKGDLRNRRYFATEASFAKYSPNFGYLFGRAGYSSFIHNSNWEQGTLNLETLYFTKLSEWGNWKLRNFFIGRATLGINRNPEDLLSINNELGLRGFSSDLLRGNKRIVLNYEANLYTPFSLFGFKLATVVFTDFAWLSALNSPSPFKTKPYSGFGAGFRFRNEYLSFSTIQILLSYYPNMPPNQDPQNFRFLQATRPYYDFADFRFTQPDIARFR